MHKPLAPTGDPRWTETGAVIQHAATPYYPPTADRRGYACQPYCSVLPDGEWSCVMTFNNDSWIEGTPGEHMIATNTKDNGKVRQQALTDQLTDPFHP